MKSTESLDDTGKLVDLSSATGETGMPGDTSIMENKRRRLVRGAVAFAPLVLTLRSGALAAASCTGARIVTLGENGEFSGAKGDVCIPTGAEACPGYSDVSVGPTKIVTSPETKIAAEPVANKPNQFICIETGNSPYKNRSMAILSSTAATSLR